MPAGTVQFRVRAADGAAGGDLVEAGVDDLLICPTVTTCTTGADCDDGLYCNGLETCDAGSCAAGTPVACDDGVACTVDACDEDLGACDFAPDDAACQDALFCNGAETCDPALDCQARTPVDCDDGISCTADACNEASGACDRVPDDGLCDNGLFCDGDLTCDPGEDCQGCPADCPSFSLPAAVCGNGLCEAGDGEDCVSCPQDCDGLQGGKPSGRFCCGFGGDGPVGCGDSRCTSGGFDCTETPVGAGGTTCCGDLAFPGSGSLVDQSTGWQAGSRSPTAAPSSSTRSPRWTPASRPSCSGCSKIRPSAPWAGCASGGWTCA